MGECIISVYSVVFGYIGWFFLLIVKIVYLLF